MYFSCPAVRISIVQILFLSTDLLFEASNEAHPEKHNPGR